MLPNNTITLHGSGSDSDGVIVSYAWSQLSGATASLSGVDTPDLAVSELVQMVVQVNGKVRARFEAPPDTSKEDLEGTAMAIPRVQELISGRDLVKTVVIPGRLVSIVIK